MRWLWSRIVAPEKNVMGAHIGWCYALSLPIPGLLSLAFTAKDVTTSAPWTLWNEVWQPGQVSCEYWASWSPHTQQLRPAHTAGGLNVFNWQWSGRGRNEDSASGRGKQQQLESGGVAAGVLLRDSGHLLEPQIQGPTACTAHPPLSLPCRQRSSGNSYHKWWESFPGVSSP